MERDGGRGIQAADVRERFQGGRLKEPLNEGCCRGTGGGRLVQSSLQSSLGYFRELIDFGGGSLFFRPGGIGLIRSKWEDCFVSFLLFSLFLFALIRHSFDTPRLEVYRFIILELYTLKMKNIDELS